MLKTNSPFDLIPEESGGGGSGSNSAGSETIVGNGSRAHIPISLSSDREAPNISLAAAAAAAAAAAVTTRSVDPGTAPLLAQEQVTPTPSSLLLNQQHILATRPTLFQDLALQQHIQRQVLEYQIQKNREIMQVEHERQLSIWLQQAQLKKAPEDVKDSPGNPIEQRGNHERLRLEGLKQKSSQDQSANASPEVKRHLQAFVRRRKEAAASMTNLRLVPTTNSASSSPPSSVSSTGGTHGSAGSSSAHSTLTNNSVNPQLRKTASESNLLKMKSKRCLPSVAPYHQRLQSSAFADKKSTNASSERSAAINIPNSSGDKNSTSPPVELGSPGSLLQDRVIRATSSAASSPGSVSASSNLGSSAPSSPKIGMLAHRTLSNTSSTSGPTTVTTANALLPKQQRSLDSICLQTSHVNSKSLPNIPSAVSHLVGKESLSKRKSPPPASANLNAPPPPHHGALIVKRSKSSAILPLRKHLIEKSLQESKKSSMDEEQFYYQQKQIARERLMIRPIEEVMEEDLKPSDNMDVDDQQPNQLEQQQPQHQHHLQKVPHSFTARMGPLGLSPLVLSEVGSGSSSSEYITCILPKHPLNLATTTTMIDETSFGSSSSSSNLQTGLGYDPMMLKHQCLCETSANHPESPDRLLSIWNHLLETGLADRCVRVARRATLEEIRSCHSETHTLLYGTDMVNRCSLTGSQELHRQSRLGKFCPLDCGGVGVDLDTYWNEVETPAAVRTAVGTLIELSQKVARNELRNGFAIIRPPGHHAEHEEAMGFCYFNSVAIAACQLRQQLPTVARRIMIVDWAIHHGNGTQKVFYDNPDVLYISLHRHDNGNFYPGTGSPVECGSGPGLGYNVNIAWAGGLSPPMGDAEYLAAFRSIIMPIARSYAPDIVLVSAGFDAAAGHPHPIGGYLVSTACFAYMTLQLRQVARGGRVILALEGGFNLDVLANASEQCVRALLGLPIEKIAESELARRPCANASETLQKTLAIQTPYWEVLRHSQASALLSHLEAWEKSREENEALNAMACLTMTHSGGK